MPAFAYDDPIEPDAPLVVSETIDGEAIIMHHGTGRYFDTAGTGALIWQAVAAGASASDIAAALVSACNIAPDRARAATERFVGELAEHALVRAAPASVPPRLPAAAFAEPVLGVHDDLADMLLLDPIHDVDEAGWPAARQHGTAA